MKNKSVQNGSMPFGHVDDVLPRYLIVAIDADAVKG